MRCFLIVLALALGVVAQSTPSRSSGPVVFIDGNGSEQEAARDTQHVDRDDQTMEFTRNMLKFCPEVSLTRDEEGHPDYFLIFNRGKQYGMFANAISQVMLLDRNKNVIFATKKGTVAQATKAGCKAVLDAWKSGREKKDVSQSTK